MGNIMDYLDWRGDLTYSVDPFNEVDNLIMSTLAYVDFEGIMTEPGQQLCYGIRHLNEQYWKLHTHEEVKARKTFYRDAPFLMEKMASCRRYRRLRVERYVNYVDPSHSEQMAAITIYPGNGSTYVAFRGTDDTLTGWKEDFSFSYMEATEGQLDAVNYLNSVQEGKCGRLIVGGHSKGGNFAIYASAFCKQEIRDRIETIYSNDGPGLGSLVDGVDGYRQIARRIRKYTPAYSIVGVLLAGEVVPKLISSDQDGIMQHDEFTWQVMGNHFVEAPKRETASELFEKIVNAWIDSESPEERKLFVETIFDLLAATGAQTLGDLGKSRSQTVSMIVSALKRMPPETRDPFLQIIRDLGSCGTDILKTHFQTETGRLLDKVRAIPKRNTEQVKKETQS